MIAKKRAEKKTTQYEGFEKGIRLLHEQEYKTAKASFQKFITEFPEQDTMSDRARQFIHLCDQELSPPKPKRHTADDFHLAGVLKFNDGEFDEALADLAKAAQMDPKDPKNSYVQAAVLAAQGEDREACEHLKKAVKLDDRFRVAALSSPDFESLREDEEFIRLTAQPGKK